MPTLPQSQGAPGPQPPDTQSGPPQPTQAASPIKPQKLHDLALGAEKNLEQLATALAHSGADQQTVGVVTKMADVARKIGVAIVKGQGQQPQGPEQTAPPPQEQQQPQPQQHTMGSATSAMQEDLKARRAQQGGTY